MIHNMNYLFKGDPRLSSKSVLVVICPDGPILVNIDKNTVGMYTYGEFPFSTYTGYRACGSDGVFKLFQNIEDAITYIVELHFQTGLFFDFYKISI